MLQIYGGSGHGRVIADAYLLNQPANTIEFYDDGKSMDRFVFPPLAGTEPLRSSTPIKGVSLPLASI